MSDAELIEKLGGPAALAERLGYDKDGGVQRVQNWRTRGIPAQVKVEFPAIFIPGFGQVATQQPATQQAAAAN